MHGNSAIILTLILALTPARLWAQVENYTWTGNAGNGEWRDAGNWAGGIDFPQVGDNATIGGNATVSVSAGLGTFSINNLNLSGTLNIQETGNISIAGVVGVSGTIRSSGNTSFLGAITLTGDSTFEFSGSGVSFGSTIFGPAFNLLLSCGAAKPQFSGSISAFNLMITTTSSDDWLCPTVNAPLGNFIISSQSNSPSEVTLDNSSFINVHGLLLRGEFVNYTLSHDSNSISTLASDNTKGDITVRSNKSITIGSISTIDAANETVTGINSLDVSIVSSVSIGQNANAPIFSVVSSLTAANGAGDITLTSANNSFTFLELRGDDVRITQSNVSLTIGSIRANNLLLKSDGDATQSTASIKDASGGNTCRLQIEGAGPFLLPEAENRVDTIAVNTTGSLYYLGGGNLKVGTLDLANSGTPIVGINTGGNLTLQSTIILERGMQIGGNLDIKGGTLNAGSQTIEIAGNMDVKAANAFNGGTGTVRFIQSDSILKANGSTFNNLEVVNSNLNIQDSDFTATGTVRIASNNNPAQLKFVRGNHSAEIANLILEGASAPLVDFTNWNFNVSSSLDNEDGEIKLTGEQAGQVLAYDSADKKNMGLVRYYNGVGAGTVRHGNFWNLKIDAPSQSIRLGSDIDIHGYYNPNSDKTLSTPVSESNLIGLHLSSGTFFNTANRTIRLRGSYIKADTVMISGNLKLILLGDYPAYIGGNNEFLEFICEDASVQGKIIYFQSGKTTMVAAHSDAKFAIRGRGTYPPGNQLNLNSPVFPSPRSYVYVLSSQPANQTHYWFFNRTSSSELELEFVYLLHSSASPNPQAKPVNVTFQDCPNWLDPPYIMLSWTKDIGDSATAVHNGRIDKILVDSSVNLNMDFEGIEVEVEGYKVKGFQAHNTNTDQFYIELEEQSYLDTSATPRWKIIRNDSLKDNYGFELRLYDGGENSSKAKEYETPYDDAAPIIGYTLAIADKNQIFVHFSEPVVRSTSSSITKDDFSTTAGGGVSSLKRVSSETHSGMREVVLTSSDNISAENILDEVEISTSAGIRDIHSSRSIHDFDENDAVDGTDTLVKSTHRVSDLGLGVVGNGLMEPISARGDIMPVGGSGSGVVTSFAWNNFLPEDDFSIIAHRYTGILEEPRLIYSNSATAKVKNGRLWLPAFGENASLARNFSGLVPRPHMQTLTKREASSSNDNYTYQFRVPDEMLENGRDLEFVFYFANSELYCAQVRDDTASNWYRQVIPWAIRIRDVAVQAGNVSILNNILNPNNGDNTSIYYELRTGGVVTVQVFDLSGDTVAVLQRGFQNAGKYTVSWNGRNGAGNPVARGIYFIRLVGPDRMDQIRKVLVVK